MSSTNYIVYDDVTGAIIKTGHTSVMGAASKAGVGETAMETQGNNNDATQYVDITGTPTVTDKSAMGTSIDTSTITADGIDISTISSIPEGVTAGCYDPDGALVATTVIDSFGELEITADAAGDWVVKLSLFPYLDEEHTIAAT